MDKLDLLERVARRLPVTGRLTFRRAKHLGHDIYLAFGRGDADVWYAIWGQRIGTQTVARWAEFGHALTQKQVIQALFDDAVWYLRESQKRSMTDEGWWTSGRVK